MDLHVNNILNDLEKDDVQAYLLTKFTNVEYISGYKPTSFAFCIIKVIKELKSEGINRLAIEPSLPFSTYEKFSKDFEIGSGTYVDKQRMIKTSLEIEKIAKATEIAQKSFLQLDILNNDNTEKEVAFDLVGHMIKNGAAKESFDTIVTSGANSSLPTTA